uniref:Uncharacterized protein n=1 Tax=Rhizophora mucronata TaxID=61149 RepID=A0A2P2P5W9_RHIMU
MCVWKLENANLPACGRA